MVNSKKKTILILGGSGYVGSHLINKLYKLNKIINYDLDLYGSNHLPKKYINHIRGDIRDTKKLSKILLKYKPDELVHLACISNDPGFLLNKNISKEINYTSFKNLIKICKNSSLKKFLFVSTCSVYGVSKSKSVTEEHPLKPITLYNKYKGESEKILQDRNCDSFKSCIIRPATVCGVSPKMRFDLSVNILTNYAYNKNYIKVFGGEQKRPNIHIDDIVNLYCKLIKMKSYSQIDNECFNAGGKNLKIIQIANKVKKIVQQVKKTKIKIFLEKSNDQRSYHINSNKIKKILNFEPRKDVDEAIKDLCLYFKKKKKKDTFTNKNYFNVKKLLSLKL